MDVTEDQQEEEAANAGGRSEGFAEAVMPLGTCLAPYKRQPPAFPSLRVPHVA